MEIPEIDNELLQVIKTNLGILFEAIEADENPEKQIAYRKMAAIGTYDSTEGGSFQIITEICVNEDFFMVDGDIAIITDPQYQDEPYQTTPAQVAMDSYAKGEVNEFIEWTIKNKWSCRDDRIWLNFGVDISDQKELTFDQLFDLYKSSTAK